MAMTAGFKQWLVEEKNLQRGKWKTTCLFLLLPVLGEIVLARELLRSDVVIVPEIGGNKLTYFIQAIIFKYLLWIILSPFVAGLLVRIIR